MKIHILAFTLVAMAMTSCDMELEQVGSIDTENAIETKTDCQQFLNGIYNNLRSRTAGSYITLPDIQADMFQGTIINGNKYVSLTTGNIQSNNQDIENVFYYMYNGIASCNYFIPRVQAIINNNAESNDAAELKSMIAQAKFARAYYNYRLFDYFCQAYSADKGDVEALGIPLVFDYAPSPDRGSYPGRSTMNETIEYINQDLKEAYEGLKEYEDNVSKANCAPNAIRISSYTVEALQARVALMTNDYDTAIAKAEDVINSGIYALCEISDYANMWLNDASTELLFVPAANENEYASVPATGSEFLSQSENSADFIPASEALLMYSDKDVRGKTNFDEYTLEVSGDKVDAPVFYKFPGNPGLRATPNVNNLRNKPKPFRLSELYLIAAEAYDLKSDATNANKYLNALRAKRITSYVDQNLSGNTLTEAIRTERCKELVGEGFRLSDLKRWGIGFTRTCNYGEYDTWYNDLAENLLTVEGRTLYYSAGDYRYVWPIPQAEIEVNPQLNGQQNPGY